MWLKLESGHAHLPSMKRSTRPDTTLRNIWSCVLSDPNTWSNTKLAPWTVTSRPSIWILVSCCCEMGRIRRARKCQSDQGGIWTSCRQSLLYKNNHYLPTWSVVLLTCWLDVVVDDDVLVWFKVGLLMDIGEEEITVFTAMMDEVAWGGDKEMMMRIKGEEKERRNRKKRGWE